MSLKMKYHWLFSGLWIKHLTANQHKHFLTDLLTQNDEERFHSLATARFSSNKLNLWFWSTFNPNQSLSQKRIPKANGGPTHPEGDLQPFCVVHQLLPEKHLLCTVWQREHRHLPSGDGQAGWQVKTRVPWPAFVVFWLLFVASIWQEGRGASLSRRGLSRWSAVDIFVPLSSLFFFFRLRPFKSVKSVQFATLVFLHSI